MTGTGASEDCLQPGTPLLHGQFLVERFLNAGGFGITYLARDSLDRRVVLKECYPSSMVCRSEDLVRARSRVHQPEFETVVRLFGQEARRLSKLQHPNIVGVHQVFEDNGTAYMALDYVEGQDLLDIIEEDPERLTPDRIREMLLSILDAVVHVHSQNILHRDISPDNILLRTDGEPVLIDFGAARDEARRRSRVLSAVHVVKDGYSPQEFYLTGTAQGPESDLYSLAATFYHLITGEAPPHSHVRLAAIAAKTPDPYLPLVDRIEGYEPRFLAAIDTAMSIFPEDRLASADDWLDMIDDTRRQAVLLQRAASDDEIERRIVELVRETNVDVAAAQTGRAKREAAAEAMGERQRASEAKARSERQRASAAANKILQPERPADPPAARPRTRVVVISEILPQATQEAGKNPEPAEARPRVSEPSPATKTSEPAPSAGPEAVLPVSAARLPTKGFLRRVFDGSIVCSRAIRQVIRNEATR